MQIKKFINTNFFLLFVLLFIFVRILLTFLTPLTADEAYYLQWSYHPALSYIDHPGMVAWINSVFIFIFKEPLLAIRLASWTCLFVSILFVYKAIHYLTNNKTKSIYGAILYFLIPYNFIFALTMQVDQPLLMFFSIAIYYSFKYIKENKPKYLYMLTTLFGLAMLSKYMIVIPITTMFVYLIFHNRKLIFNKHFLFSIALFIFMISPILIWNFNNNWLSFSFHTSRIGTEPLFKSFFEYILEQFLYITPMIWIILFKQRKFDKNEQEKIVYILFITVMVFFLIFSIKTKIWAHWTSLAYYPLCVYLAAILEEIKLKRLIIHLMIFITLLVLALGFTGPRVFLDQGKFNENKLLATKLEKEINLKLNNINVFSDFHGACGELSYYLKKQVYMPTELLELKGRWGENQHKLWQTKNNSNTTGPILVFASAHFEDALNSHFKNVRKLPNIKMYTIEGHITSKQFYLCVK